MAQRAGASIPAPPQEPLREAPINSHTPPSLANHRTGRSVRRDGSELPIGRKRIVGDRIIGGARRFTLRNRPWPGTTLTDPPPPAGQGEDPAVVFLGEQGQGGRPGGL